MLASLHELTNKNRLQTGRSFCEIAKQLAQVQCFKKFVWVGNFTPIINRRGVGWGRGLEQEYYGWKKIERLISGGGRLSGT